MNPVARAKQVWRDAQNDVVAASARLLEPMDSRQLVLAQRRYEEALDRCAIAKSFYDMMREIDEAERAVAMHQSRAC